MRKIMTANFETSGLVAEGIDHLRKARDCFAKANCPKTLERTRAALSSAQGAQRHAAHRINRLEDGDNQTRH